MTLATLYLSGETRRWHANPVMVRTGQTIADHQCRAAQLLLALNPGANAALIFHVLHHDVGEALAGDLPQPFKAANPVVAASHAAVESQLCAGILGNVMPWLNAVEQDWAKLVDLLEAALFTLFHALPDYYRPGSGWVSTEADIMRRARALGCADAVETLIDDIIKGVF